MGERILLAHGSGGKLSHDLVEKHILDRLILHGQSAVGFRFFVSIIE